MPFSGLFRQFFWLFANVKQAKFQLTFGYAHAIIGFLGVIAREGIRKFDALTGRFLTHRRIGIMMW